MPPCNGHIDRMKRVTVSGYTGNYSKNILTNIGKSSIIKSGGDKVSEKKQFPRISEISASRITEKINSGEYSTKLSHQQYLRHIEGTVEYNNYKQIRQAKGQPPQSILTISEREAQELIIQKAGTGIVTANINGDMIPMESITADRIIGITWSGGKKIYTNKARIHYGIRSSHIVPIGGLNYD